VRLDVEHVLQALGGKPGEGVQAEIPERNRNDLSSLAQWHRTRLRIRRPEFESCQAVSIFQGKISQCGVCIFGAPRVNEKSKSKQKSIECNITPPPTGAKEA
jgi:hypothetical protein